MAQINPYIHFAGTTEEAFNFYKSVFGSEFAMLQRFGEMPGCDGTAISEADKNKIMHVALPIGGNILMATDMLESMGQKLEAGNNFSISIDADTREDADRLYARLSEGGNAEMPMTDAFWGYFGMLHDQFGMRWMINFNEKSVQQ